MTTFVIFWASVGAIICFLFGTLFKALASGFYACIGSIKAVSKLLLILFIVFVVYGMMDALIQDGIMGLLSAVFSLAIIIGLAKLFFGWLGRILLEIGFIIAEAVADFLTGILNWCAAKCEKGYIKSLSVIVKNLDNC